MRHATAIAHIARRIGKGVLMRYLILCFAILVLAPAAHANPTYGPIAPGSGERAVTAAAPDEIGSYYVWRMGGKKRLVVGHDHTACKIGKPGDCSRISICSDQVTTEVCEFSRPSAAPGKCTAIRLRAGQAATVQVSGPYAGVKYTRGLCLAGNRLSRPLPSGQQFWRFPSGKADDMARGGGSPQPGGTTWYVHPRGGPR